MVDSAPSAGEVRAFAQQLLAWADRLARTHRPCRVLADADRHELVQALAEAARERARIAATAFPDAGLVSPAWRVLLEIFIREGAGYRVLLEDLKQWNELPLLTILGNLNNLIEKGLVERHQYDGHTCGVRLSLSAKAGHMLAEMLLESAGHAPLIDRAIEAGCASAQHR